MLVQIHFYYIRRVRVDRYALVTRALVDEGFEVVPFSRQNTVCVDVQCSQSFML